MIEVRQYLLAAVVLGTVFVSTRTTLLLTSYDNNKNWEEPVFLFSATDLARHGLTDLFDYQDDLNHGGSVVLLLLAVPWVSWVTSSLVGLKGVAIIWAGLTLAAFVTVGWRYFSPRVGLLWGLFYTLLSPTATRLNVTLVGSHPEALLPCAAALGAYLEWAGSRGRRLGGQGGSAFALGVAGGLALWVAYIAAMFVVPLLVIRLIWDRRGRVWLLLLIGLLVGLTPWLYQDAWLRPHGAMMWLRHVGGARAAAEGWAHALGETTASFGYEGGADVFILGICAAAYLYCCFTQWRVRRWPALVIAPFLVTPPLGLAVLAHAAIPLYPNEGYYHYRFFLPLQVALFWVLALAIDSAATHVGRAVTMGAVTALLIVGVWGQAPLYAQGNHYHADFDNDRAEGCLVFGLAEWDRAPSPAAAVTRLQTLSGGHCRDRAFAGFGWGLGSSYLAERDLSAAFSELRGITDSRLRWAACGGFAFILNRTDEATLTHQSRADVLRELASECHAPVP